MQNDAVKPSLQLKIQKLHAHFHNSSSIILHFWLSPQVMVLIFNVKTKYKWDVFSSDLWSRKSTSHGLTFFRVLFHNFCFRVQQEMKPGEMIHSKLQIPSPPLQNVRQKVCTFYILFTGPLTKISFCQSWSTPTQSHIYPANFPCYTASRLKSLFNVHKVSLRFLLSDMLPIEDSELLS